MYHIHSRPPINAPHFCRSWPSLSNIEQKTIAFLETTLKEAYRDRNVVLASQLNMDYVPSSQDDEENATEYKHASLNQEEVKGTPSLYYCTALGFENNHSIHTAIAIQSHYDQWMERMKIPPKVERDPLDLDFPTGLFESALSSDGNKKSAASLLQQFIPSSSSQQLANIVVAPQSHPPGPYLDVKLTQACNKEDFEKLTLQHFFVFDNRFKDEVIEEEEGDEEEGAVTIIVPPIETMKSADPIQN